MIDNEINIIITDFDGVILESESVKDDAFTECFSIFPDHLCEIIDYHRNNITMNRYDKFVHIFEKILNKKYSNQYKIFISDRFNDIVFNKVIKSSFVPGSYKFLETYYQYLPIWIVSGTPREELLKVLNALDIKKYFKKIFSTPPHKTIILQNILSMTKIKSDNVIYIGDMKNDYTAAISK